MTTESLIITVPDLGGADDVDVIELLVKEGDEVDSEQSVVTLETDKASMEIPAGKTGRVKTLLVKLGDKVSMGDPMLELVISENESEKKADKTASEIPEPDIKAFENGFSKTETLEVSSEEEVAYHVDVDAGTDAQKDISTLSNEVHAGPSVRLLARELGVDLTEVQGTGMRERITRDDVQVYVKARLKTPANFPTSLVSENTLPKVPDIDFSKYGEIESQPLSKIKLLTAKNMTAAWLNVPHVTQFDQANITDLEAFRKQVNKQQVHQQVHQKKDAIKLSIVPFVMKALAAALKEFPQFNSSLSADGQSLIYKKYIHIGVAVDTPNGLLVPVIRDVDKKSVMEIAADLNDRAEKARLGKLGLADMQGGCISVSSLGGIGGTAFTPIVNAPEVAILGLSKAEIKPLWQTVSGNTKEAGEFVPALMLPLSLSYDHRVVDGAEAARFSQFLVAILSDIRRLVL
jgi:pyruvate dehydrogenase E2 component (dihydrolipoamide acetyltransferase)